MHGYIQTDVCVMADNGFTIANELNKTGIGLNISPFATGSQMSMSDTYLTCTGMIAQHGVTLKDFLLK